MTKALRCGALAVVAVLMLWTEASAVQFTFNNHTYELIETSGSWISAQINAQGNGGYLVNITSSAENQFLVTTFAKPGQQFFAWIGASDQVVEGQWQWMDGPEAGTQFWQGGPVGSGGAAVGGNFANWDVIEPNNSSDEDAAALNLGATQSGSGILNGKWGDTDIQFVSLPGFIIERDLPPTSSAVPEPSAMIALLLGASALGLRRAASHR